jgi:hypothetical protein
MSGHLSYAQLYLKVDPDSSRTLADKLVRQLDRVKVRGQRDTTPTEKEIRRATNELARRGVPASPDDVRAALSAALSRPWGE